MSDDTKAIERVVNGLADAFNAKNAKAFAAAFAEDAEFVSIFGARMRRRAGIEAGHVAVFSRALSGTRLVLDAIEAKELGPSVALVHAPWTRELLPDAPEGALPPGTGIFTIVLSRAGDGWQIAALTNVATAAPPK